ncbi:MAG: DNA-binding MarR family transcriptional regulator [Alteromonas macleodii]|jgi:DNA-binding MarR family transcriptional regulator
MSIIANQETDLEYILEEQVGYLLRLASQRHSVIFQKYALESMTPTQFSTLIRVAEIGEVSQNHLGRLTAMDVATIKGVVDRLKNKNLITSRPDEIDKRRTVISLTANGTALVAELRSTGLEITRETLSPLTPKERITLVALLRKIS